jgi:hypothetical protein
MAGRCCRPRIEGMSLGRQSVGMIMGVGCDAGSMSACLRGVGC